MFGLMGLSSLARPNKSGKNWQDQEVVKAYSREYYAKHRDYFRNYYREYDRRRRLVDPSFKLAKALRTRLSLAIRGKAGSAVRDLGCSIEMLKSWLMYQFQPGMTWENYGEWEIDHVRPLSSFDLTNREQFIEAANWYNLQPLWAADNRAKQAKFIQKA